MTEWSKYHFDQGDDRLGDQEYLNSQIGRAWRVNRPYLHQCTELSEDELNFLQLRKLTKIVEHAYQHSPFYNRLYSAHGFRSGDLRSWTDFEALPTVTKGDIIDNYDDVLASGLYKTDELFYSRTSGSSGRVTTVMQSQRVVIENALYYLRFYEQCLGRARLPDDLICEVYLAPSRYSNVGAWFPIDSLSLHCPPNVFAQYLDEKRPKIVSSFPSYLLRAVDAGIDFASFGVEAIIVNSESSTPGERTKIGNAFSCPVMQEYSSEELYLIATECPKGKMHIVADNVHVSLLGDQLCATSLVNSDMPYIKFIQGDTADKLDVLSNKCECGSNFPVLLGFSGRQDQTLVDEQGRDIPPDLLMMIYDEYLLTGRCQLDGFRIEQHSSGIKVLIEGDRGAADNDTAVEEMCSKIGHLVGDSISVEAVFLEALPDLFGVKRRVIINYTR